MPPYPVREIEHRWIEMPDGVRLAARIWLPERAGAVPAILEYIPYRKRDMVRTRDERNHPYFAAHGYACLRVDMRGSGDSEGVMADMYGPAELDDARQVIAWIARQDWCNGKVGMFGTSWGGTASLQAALDAPGPLKAVIANCATIDRYEDDIHWMGGCVLTDTIEWAATLPAILAAPPDKATVGDGWFASWKHRLGNLTFPHESWIRETRRVPYWQRGSIRFETDRLSCPILAIGGWSDRYSNSVMPLVEARPDICRGIVGPWGHHYPDQGEPGPAIGFQDLALDWWDSWLKREAPEMPDWPALRLWRREFDPPQDRLVERNGSWIEIGEPTVTGEACFHLGDGSLSAAPHAEPRELTVPDDPRHGQCSGDTGYFGRVGGLPLEQTPDDERALCFDSQPLGGDLCTVGHAWLRIDVTPGSLPAQLACRVCDVAPDGRSGLVTRTVVNLELDDDLNTVRGVAPGQRLHVRVKFPTTAYRFAAGHRVRLALGSSYWPLIWPPGRPARSKISTSGARLNFPLQPDTSGPLKRRFPPARELFAGKGLRTRSESLLQRCLSEDSGAWLRNAWHQPAVTMEFEDIDIAFTFETTAEFGCDTGEASRATCSVEHRIEVKRHDGLARISSKVVLLNSPGGARSRADIKVTWNGVTVANMNSGTLD